MQYKVLAPVRGFTGEVAGVHFVRGEAVVDDGNKAAMQYFRRRHYGISEYRPGSELGPELGTPTRPAAHADADGAGGGEQADPKRPPKNAVKDDWAAYAAVVVPGLTAEQAAAMTKPELVDLVGRHDKKEDTQ